MAKYKVIAYAANIGKKSVRAHTILDESQIDKELLPGLIKGNFIKEISEKDLRAEGK